MTGVLYPQQFELSRLEASGEPPYLDVDDARQRYDAGQSIRVVPEGNPPAWFLLVSPKRHRFLVTYYADSRTPLREVTWEDDGDGLLCRRIIDLFYPDGDPAGRVPYAQIFSVTQQISADGVVEATLASPIGDDDFREASGVSLDEYRSALPAFGEWEPLLAAGAPPTRDRFGLDAIDAALARLDDGVAGETPGTSEELAHPADGWRVSAGSGDIMKTVDGVLSGVPSHLGVPVIERGAARILPLAAQSDPRAGGRDAQEERRRMAVLAADVGDALEYREGRGIRVDLDRGGDDSVGSYVSALRDAAAERADYWAYGPDHAAVLVWTGEEAAGTLALAVHLVPAGWIIERRAAAAVDGIDLSWSLAQVHEPQGAPAGPDSLGSTRGEGKSS